MKNLGGLQDKGQEQAKFKSFSLFRDGGHRKKATARLGIGLVDIPSWGAY